MIEYIKRLSEISFKDLSIYVKRDIVKISFKHVQNKSKVKCHLKTILPKFSLRDSC